jgi:hypothetical protein
MSTIDRFFCNREIDSVFPLASTRALLRLASDHTPIIWDAGLALLLPLLGISLRNGG